MRLFSQTMFEDTNKQALVGLSVPPVDWELRVSTTRQRHVNLTGHRHSRSTDRKQLLKLFYDPLSIHENTDQMVPEQLDTIFPRLSLFSYQSSPSTTSECIYLTLTSDSSYPI